MRIGSLQTLGCAVVLAVAAVLSSCKDKPATQPAAAGKPAPAQASPYDWKPLFDGKTLTNWKTTEFGAHGEPRVSTEGHLIIPPGSPMSGITWNGASLPTINYEIELDAQRVDGSDFFCGLTFPVGKDFATLVLGGWGGTVTGISSINGMDASENETSSGRDYKQKQWYHVRLRVMQDKIVAHVDDEAIVDVVIKNKRLGTRLEVEDSKPLGVATYQTTGALRNFRMRQLRAEEIETVTDPLYDN